MPKTADPNPKRRYIRSKWENKKVVQLSRSSEKSLINKEEDGSDKQEVYLLWDEKNNNATYQKYADLTQNPQPRQNLPGHDESYNPPMEYLLKNKELALKWENSENLSPTFMSRAYKSLRLVPSYEKYIYEQFNRCLDLYLCPRIKKEQVNINPLELVPKLPKSSDLEPFPKSLSIIYTGHRGAVLSLSPDPSGQWLASGSMDGAIKLWEVTTGRCLHTWDFKAPVMQVAWCPLYSQPILSACVASEVHIFSPGESSIEIERNMKEIFMKESFDPDLSLINYDLVCIWRRCHHVSQGVTISHKHRVKYITWHTLGDCIVSVSPDNHACPVVLNHLSGKVSKPLFQSIRGKVVRVLFHPTNSILYVAFEYEILIYDFVKQCMVHKLSSHGGVITCLAIHKTGNHFITGSEDKKVRWYGLAAKVKPYRIMRYHTTLVKAVAFHSTMPLFASASDDGTCQVFHGMVFQDDKNSPKLVPLKILYGHESVNSNGVLDCVFHPTQPWLFTSGADGKCRLFCN